DEARAPDGRHEYVGPPLDLTEVPRPRMTDSHRRVRTEEEYRHRLSDNVAPPDDHGLLPLDVYIVVFEHLHDPVRRARDEPRMPLDEEADVIGMEPVHVLERRDGPEYARFVYVAGERELYEYAVDL